MDNCSTQYPGDAHGCTGTAVHSHGGLLPYTGGGDLAVLALICAIVLIIAGVAVWKEWI